MKTIGCKEFPVILESEIKELAVSRYFLSSSFGGSAFEVFPNIGEDWIRKHGMNDFMYLNPDFQPIAPGIPGGGALWIDVEPADLQGNPPDSKIDFSQMKRVFSRMKPNEWQFVGMYRVKPADPPYLTAEEWKLQGANVCLYDSVA